MSKSAFFFTDVTADANHPWRHGLSILVFFNDPFLFISHEILKIRNREYFFNLDDYNACVINSIGIVKGIYIVR